MFLLGFLFALQRKNPILQKETSTLPASRDAPGSELGLGIFPGSSLVIPARPALPGGFAPGRGARRCWCRGGGGRTAELLA